MAEVTLLPPGWVFNTVLVLWLQEQLAVVHPAGYCDPTNRNGSMTRSQEGSEVQRDVAA
jgi:hypothetical protein